VSESPATAAATAGRIEPAADPAAQASQFAWDLGWRDDDVTRLDLRHADDSQSSVVLYGASLTDIVRCVCRRLGLDPRQLDLARAGTPPRVDQCWAALADGRRVARITGAPVGWLKIELARHCAAGWRPDPAAPYRHPSSQQKSA